MKVLVTGSNGFMGNNLRVHLSERKDIEVVTFSRDDDLGSLVSKLDGVDFVFHLAGVNRPKNVEEFTLGIVPSNRSNKTTHTRCLYFFCSSGIG